MLGFLRAIFYSAALDPIFAKVASILNVSKQVCKEYCTSGVLKMCIRDRYRGSATHCPGRWRTRRR